jgi:peptide/nickel transport system permease protein
VLHITWRHVLPNTATTLIVGTSLTAAAALILASSLSYLGLGTQPPDPSWGNMLHDSFQFLIIAPWYGVIPGVCIALVAIGYSWIGDGVEQSLSLHGAGARVHGADSQTELVRPQ